ncbi:TonB-dependent siderophore receptor [Chelativorans sp. AA-79]|uniref:TonB-dependent siderophore receptor n=1 Tax=Chelativorans sp. AA-79 TaxID=3028735 RepID=UPI0023F99576|nr:TonB-dependent siderophore receptor [Chelativorans sp. AA-79]WEX08223.1 TonB-dependent siderophore receptor [Chelativorans sp. AA-79]
MRISGTARLVLLGSVAAVTFANGGFAQEVRGTTWLERIEIEGEGETAAGPVDGYVAERTAAGSKTDTPLAEIPQSVSVIGREEMDDLGATKADEALRYTAGVFAQPFGPDRDTNWIYIRGFEATQTGIYQDGLQLYSYGFGGFYIDSFTLERVEVLRGAASVLYGGSNPGGLVNYVSKRPTGERRVYAETGVTDAGTAFLGFDLQDRVNEQMAARLVGRIAGGDGYTDFEEGFRGTVSPSFTWSPDDATSLTVLGNFTYIDGIHNGGSFLPYVGTVVDAPFGKISRDANFTEPDIDTYLRKQVSLGYEFGHKFDSGWTVRQNARAGYADLHEIAPYAYGYLGFSDTPSDPDNLLERINFEHRTKTRSFLVDNQLEGRVETGALEHRLLFGLDYKYFDMDQVQMSGTATPISATDPVYGAPQGVRSAYIDQDLKQQQVGFYAQDQIHFGGGWIATFNGRYDYVTTESEGTSEFDDSQGAWSGRAGLAYRFENGLTPYASVSTFFNPLLGTTATGDLFDPEEGYQYEVGLKYEPTWFDGLFTVALFDLTRQNVVTGPFNMETQIGEVNSRGIEFEAKANLTANWQARAALTLLDLETKADDDPTLIGKTPYLIPEEQASFALDYTFDEGPLYGVTLGGGMRYVGSSWADEENTMKVPSATLFDARIGYQRGNLGADLHVTNLFDKEFVAGCQGALSCAYGEGRSIKLKLHATW